jgi:hypothetical protein
MSPNILIARANAATEDTGINAMAVIGAIAFQ